MWNKLNYNESKIHFEEVKKNIQIKSWTLISGNRDTEICSMLTFECYTNAKKSFVQNFILKSCNCLLDCVSIKYSVEVSMNRLDSLNPRETIYGYDNYSSLIINVFFINEKIVHFRHEAFSGVYVSFKEQEFFIINRTQTYTTSDFVASCGGLLGLFMGISMLSFVEFIYYFTLRLFCTVNQRRQIQTSDWARRNNISVIRNFRETSNRTHLTAWIES